MKKTDRRVVRTRKLLGDALMSLIMERGYESITVQNIVEQANVGRATFYAHYRDKEDLLLTTMRKGYQQLELKVREAMCLPEAIVPLGLIFEYAAQNRDLFLVILNGAGKTAAYQQARDYLASCAKEELQVLYGVSNPALEAAAMYFAAAFLGMLIWWLEQEMPRPVDEMVDTFQELFRYGVDHTLRASAA